MKGPKASKPLNRGPVAVLKEAGMLLSDPKELPEQLRLGAFGTGSALAADTLVRAASDRFHDLSAAQSSLVLASLALSSELSASKVGLALRQKLVSTLELRCQELSPQSAAALVPALVKLRSSGGMQLAPGVAQRIVEGEGLAVNDIAAAAAGLAALRTTPAKLLAMADQAVQSQVHLCTPRAVVQLAASLSEGGADADTFKDYLMPAARSFLLDFGPRDLCTLAQSFAKASAAETDFIADLADTLQSKVTDMGAHEVSASRPGSKQAPTQAHLIVELLFVCSQDSIFQPLDPAIVHDVAIPEPHVAHRITSGPGTLRGLIVESY